MTSIKFCRLFLGVIFFVLPVSAQQFFSLDWHELPPAHTFPIITRKLPLHGKDVSLHTYHPVLEYPEYMPLTLEERMALQTAIDSLRLSVPEEISPVLRDALKGDTLSGTPCMQASVGVSAHGASLYVSLFPVVFRDGIYQRLRSFKLSYTTTSVSATKFSTNTLPHTRVQAVSRSATSRSQSDAVSLLSTGNWVKIRVGQTGIHKISNATLRKMGFARPDKVRIFGYGGYLLSQRFQEHPDEELPEVPLLVTSDGVLFHARGTVSWKPNAGRTFFVRERNFYSDESCYFLTDREDIPRYEATAETVETSSENNILTVFNDYALYEKEGYSWGGTGRHLYEDYDYAANNTRNYEFSLPGIVSGVPAILTAVFAARAVNASSSCSVMIDGTLLRTALLPSISSDKQYYTRATSVTMHVPWTETKSERPVVTVRHERPSGVSGRLDYLALNYTRSLTLSSAFLAFRSLNSIGKVSTFVVSGATPATVVWDVTNPGSVAPVRGIYAGEKFTFTIPAGTLREFVAVNPESGGFPEITAGERVVNQNLHGLTATDMVIIVPDRQSLIAHAGRLAQAHRAKDGFRVEIVTAPQVYNEFSSGTPDATAYRRFMKMLYDRFPSETERPKYLLLFGDCSYDNRMLTGSWKQASPGDFLLCYQSENSLEETSSYVTDDYFGFLDDSEGENLASSLLDIGVGRFPVRTAEEARVAVDKTIAYMNNAHAGAWKNSVCYVADDGDRNLHVRQSEQLAAYTEENHPSLLVHRIYADAFRREDTATGNSYPDATKRLKQLLHRGLLAVNYTGHGSTTAWAEENLLTAGDIDQLSSPRLPLWITATCDFTRFDDAATSAGERALLNPKGGAIALLTTSRVVYASQNSTLNRAFLRHIFTRPEGKRLRLGDMMRLAKCDGTLYGDRNKLNFSLIGDPALMLACPEYEVKIEEFAGVDVSREDASFPMVKAGMKVKVKGRILTPSGTPADDFTGMIYPTVLDSKEKTTTLDNLKQGAFAYEERGKTLYEGNDSVRGGTFEFIFPVPLDINYSEKTGMLNLYALDAGGLREAAGSFERFLVGGTASDLENDMEGPQIRLYLNTSDFVSGGKTNTTPMLVAELEDKDGINTVGAGIGHDLWLRIDGNAHLTYTLNDYFHSVAGDYTRGTVRFSLPELPEGRHTLSFRAWDLHNNSSLRSLDFEVVRGLRPELFSLSCTHSPARENTTFVLSHNRPGSILSVRLSVYDVSGREQWTHLENSLSEGETRYVDWDLCGNEGQRLAPGVYLYSAAIRSEESRESVKSRKLIILAK